MFTFGDAYSLRSHSQFSVFCRIIGIPLLQLDVYGLSSALKDDTIDPKKTKRNAHKSNENGAEKVNATDDTNYN